MTKKSSAKPTSTKKRKTRSTAAEARDSGMAKKSGSKPPATKKGEIRPEAAGALSPKLIKKAGTEPATTKKGKIRPEAAGALSPKLIKKAGTEPVSTKSKTRSKAAGALARIGSLISSPIETVNSVMQWLNDHLGLSLPVIPLPRWLSPLTSLWELPIIGGIPSHPPPWDIPVDGSWPGIFPQIGSPPMMLENIVIHVREQGGSPD
jgi:hypothetical protein